MQETKSISVKMCNLVIDLDWFIQSPTFLVWIFWLMTRLVSWGWFSRKTGHWIRRNKFHHQHRNREIRNMISKPSTTIKSTECKIGSYGASSKCERWKVRSSVNTEVEFGCFFKRVMIWWFHSDGFWMTWGTGPACAPWTVRTLPPWCCLWVFSDIKKKKSSSSMACDSWKDLNK